MTIEGVCNQALDLIGYKRHITSVWDGSRAARIMLGAWSETRDLLFATRRPDWAKRDTDLALLRQAPSDYYVTTPWTPTNNPDIPWRYEYDIPDDCIVPIQLKPHLDTLPNWRPRPISFRAKRNPLDNKYTILTNELTPILTYIYRVLDPDLWHEEFIEMMVRALAQKFQTGLGIAVRQPQPQQQEPNDANAA